MTRLSPSDIVKLRFQGLAGVRALADPLVIEVPRLEAAAYCDIADAVLAASGRKAWSWEDATGRRRPGRGLFASLLGLARDAAMLPVQVAYHTMRARRCAAAGRTGKRARLQDGCLYLRMDHLFDLASGGSVAHTAGVLNSLRRLLPHVSIVSTDRLAMVVPDRHFHVVAPQYGAGRNVPLFPALTFTSDVERWWQEHSDCRPGFIYGRYAVGNYAGPILRRLLDVPYVCEYNGSAIWIARNWDKRPLRFERVFQAVEDANLHGADLIVAVSAASRDELVERGYPARRILVNPNGVDPDDYHPDIPAAPVRQRLGIGAEETVVGFIGTFGQWHGTPVLAEAFVRLLARRPDLRLRTRLLLIGDGVTMPETRAILERGGAMDRVVLAGVIAQAEGPAHLAACDILASPHVHNQDNTRFFGSPTKLFEYMAMGRAIVASSLEQIGDILDHDRTALLVPPGDAATLAAALETAITGPDLRARLAAASRRAVLERYTWLQHTQRIVSRLAEDAGSDCTGFAEKSDAT